ncbi:MAG TPA: NADH dehydrogenase FAD-containing subunit [Lentisphaeria bacterium]|nr:MAG: NADH dehydrogenase [Lentisphaerae bacterium GWF2_49_21]HBC86956.1 NADH dehydrogenase FAD-containing subunit [Lentisphaeria bacterium]
MLALIILLPAVAGLAAFFITWPFLRRALLLLTAVSHAALIAFCWIVRPEPILNGWIALDSAGLLFMTVSGVLFLAASIYAIGYLSREPKEQQDTDEGFFFTNTPENIFIACLQLFLSAMALVCTSQHFGLLWVAIEATTLASAPLIYFHRHHRSLEATWKYVLICSVGIGLALLGTLILTVSASAIHNNLMISELTDNSQLINPEWLKAAFLLFLVGYGTKMGLAPLHTWLPAAHSESPSLVSALLSGALLNCSFLGILRIHQVCVYAGQSEFSCNLLIFFGLFSMAVAAVFIIAQKDFKRMLAYSSVEHMGILALGVGLGGTAVFASMYHLINHSLTKGMLFLAAGNIIAFYKTRTSSDVKGILKRIPATGILWTAGLFAIAGFPPFGLFVSEFTIFKTAFDQGHFYICAIFLALLALIFAGMAYVMLNMSQGENADGKEKESLLMVLPPVVLGIITLILGLYIPDFLTNVLNEISIIFGAL